MSLDDWIAKYPRVQALLARPDDVLDYGPEDGRDDRLDTPTAESCGFCGASLTRREVEINRTRLGPLHAEARGSGWPFRFKPMCARCFED
jgi:hypothetical protein